MSISSVQNFLPTKIKFDEAFFEEETRCNFYVTRKRKELWAILLDLWQEFDRVCRKYGLRYYLYGGTLLGAVRHKGFIPWDDDFDVVMFRNDYNKLLEIGPSEFRHPYFFQHGYTDLNFSYARHVKIRNSETFAESPAWLSTNYNHGVFFDVFALDALSNDESQVLVQNQELQMYDQLILSLVSQSKKNIPINIQVNGNSKRFENVLHLYRAFEECAQRYQMKPHEMVTMFVLHRTAKRRFYVKDFGEPVFIPFENFNVPVPSNFDTALKIIYGENYMTPMMSASSLHGELFVDTRHSYVEILNGFRLR